MKTKAFFELDGQEVSAFVDWKNTEILATFENDAIQANLSIDNITLVNEAATLVKTIIENNRIFEGISYKMTLYDESNTKLVFDGLLDLADDYKEDTFKNKCTVKLKKKNELLILEQQLTPLSFGYLKNLGEITLSDTREFKYVVQKEIDPIQVLMISISIYILAKEAAQSIKETADAVAKVTSYFTAGITGSIASVIYSVAIALIQAAYTIAIITAIIQLAKTLFELLIPIPRKAKVLTFRTAMAKVATHLGYGFDSNIKDLDDCVYFQTNFDVDKVNNEGLFTFYAGNKKGIPSLTDYGYRCADFFELARKLFNGKYAIIDNNIVFYNADDIYWTRQSTYKMPTIREKTKQYNTNELIANRLFSFEVDYSDEHTIKNYQGTSYEVITTPKSNIDKKINMIKGFEDVRFGVALGNKKKDKFAIERLLGGLANKVDKFTGTNFASKLKSLTGLVVVADNNFQIPKVLKLDSNNKHVARSQWSAKYIENNYYQGKSFITTINSIPNYGQKEVYNGIKIPFGFSNFLNTIEDSSIFDEQGRKGRIVSLKWRFDNGFATADYYVRQSYTNNLKEIYIEPDNIDI